MICGGLAPDNPHTGVGIWLRILKEPGNGP